MGKLTAPRSNRGEYQVKIGGRNVVTKLKVTTGNYLGLTKLPDLLPGKKKREGKTGVKGTKSFTLVFKNPITIDGIRIQRLAFPVDGKVTVKEFYSYAKSTYSAKGVGAIITPDGIQKAWDKINRSKRGLIPRLPSLPSLPSLPNLPGLDLSDLVKSGASALGGYIGGATQIPGAKAAGSALGGYLADQFI